MQPRLCGVNLLSGVRKGGGTFLARGYADLPPVLGLLHGAVCEKEMFTAQLGAGGRSGSATKQAITADISGYLI